MKRLAKDQRRQDNQKFRKMELFWYNRTATQADWAKQVISS